MFVGCWLYLISTNFLSTRCLGHAGLRTDDFQVEHVLPDNAIQVRLEVGWKSVGNGKGGQKKHMLAMMTTILVKNSDIWEYNGIFSTLPYNSDLAMFPRGALTIKTWFFFTTRVTRKFSGDMGISQDFRCPANV